MNKNTLILIVAIFALAGGYLFTQQKTPSDSQLTNRPTAMVDTSHTGSDDSMIKEGDTDSNKMVADSSQGQYVTYTADYLTKYQGKTKVLFFHATWCSTCKAADRDITKNLSNIPEDLVIIKTNYDKEGELKKKYNVTYQHTFVVVDDQGNEVTKWNGGSFQDILKRI